MNEYCAQNEGDCNTCSLVNCGLDCHNNPAPSGEIDEIVLVANSYFGGAQTVRVTGHGWEVLGDTRGQCKDGYLHFTDEAPEAGPTARLQAMLAIIWYWPQGERGDSDPKSLGSPVCQWAFAGLTPEIVSAKYLNNRKIYLA